MSEFLTNLSSKDKIIFIGGGALVVIFLVKTVTGSSTGSAASLNSSVPNQADQAIQTANAAASTEQAFEKNVGDQLTAMGVAQTAAQALQTAGIADMFTGLKQTQDQANAAMSGAISASATSQNSAIKTLQDLLNQMGRTPVYTTPVAGVSGAVNYSTPIANNGLGNVIPSMSGGSGLATGNRPTTEVVGRSVGGTQGNALVTVKTATGTSTVLAGSVFDPSSSNYRP